MPYVTEITKKKIKKLACRESYLNVWFVFTPNFYSMSGDKVNGHSPCEY